MANEKLWEAVWRWENVEGFCFVVFVWGVNKGRFCEQTITICETTAVAPSRHFIKAVGEDQDFHPSGCWTMQQIPARFGPLPEMKSTPGDNHQPLFTVAFNFGRKPLMTTQHDPSAGMTIAAAFLACATQAIQPAATCAIC